ncbi:hypothetical protein C8A05DRAFT_33887 [Staphylotrichum tortipilum]|uniref:Uncharacterized protein n=1 Tax=Staphylotrichum tortipilum TaxID=2831512 RepID=A0AAN6MM68_9PEZI|nr:hypothetical protein C8A05DRAFT_33887 [Staphylotrichum longicolle]
MKGFWRHDDPDQDRDRDRDRPGQTPPPSNTPPAESSSNQDPDERTQLLHHSSDTMPYLSPDDPAVSPYNLWTVRFARWLTVVLTCLTFVWWILMVVTVFITPPGLHVRGSPFFAFGYATAALLTLAVSLLFFTVPSRPARVLSIVNAGVLLLDAVVMLAVPGLRHAEVWAGVVSVVWAALMAAWFVGADRTVQWGKAEEEQRLTGRPESRRSVLEWGEVMLSTLALAAVGVGMGLMTCVLVLRAADYGLAPPGEMYWVDGNRYQIHLYCHGRELDAAGKKRTTVLLEGGEDAVESGLWQLAENAVKNGSIDRFCFADRPGMAWSDTAPSPFSASVASDALSEALSRAGEEGPWVLVSAGVGSLYSRVFSARHGEEVHGMLLIDPLHEDLLSRVGSPGRGFLLWVQGAISPCGIDRILAAIVKGRRAADRVWGRSSYQSGTTIFAKLQENLVAESLTRRDVVSSRAIQDKDTRLAVISSGKQIRSDREWEDKQRDLTHLTTNLEGWDVVGDAPHRVWDTLSGREAIERRLRRLVGYGYSGRDGAGV